jgi:hypothetical protein
VNGSVIFNNAQILVSSNGILLNTSGCIDSGNSTIVLNTSGPVYQGQTVDLFQYGAQCHTTFNVLVDSTGTECTSVSASYQEVQGSSTVGQVVFSTQDLCSTAAQLAATLLISQ